MILDIQMPGLTSADTIRSISDTGVKIILYSLLAEDELVASLVKAGAKGFVSKSQALDILEDAINTVAEDGTHLSENLLALSSEEDPPHLDFSAREKEIYELLAKGKIPKEVTFEIGIATSTVYTYSERVRRQLGVSSLADIAQYYEEWSKLDPV